MLAILIILLTLFQIQADDATWDMAGTTLNLNRCLTVDGKPLFNAPIRMTPCRGLAEQLWQIDDVGKWHIQADPNYCLGLAGEDIWFNELVILPCGDKQVYPFVAEYQPDNTVLYTIIASYDELKLALDTGDEYATLYYADETNPHQQWRWFQTDVDLVKSGGCDITYPFPVTDTTTYQQAIACNRVASVQLPYIPPVELADYGLDFPGAVSQDISTITQSYDFDLRFKDHAYLRISTAPENWLNTGLYARPHDIIRIFVESDEDIQGVSAQIGVHSDILSPFVDNVMAEGFLRYPSVVIELALQQGENQIRSPYGGAVVIKSAQSQEATIHITIENAVPMPYFKVGKTTPDEWLIRRELPVPYAVLESDLAVVFMPSDEIRTLSYEEVGAVAQYYTTFGKLHNQLAGLTSDSPIHEPAQGQYWYVADKQISYGWGYAGFPIMTYNEWYLGTPSDTVFSDSGTWGQYHELGHNYQMDAWSYVYGTEVTVNLFSLYAQEILHNTSSLVTDGAYARAIAILDDAQIADKWGYLNDDPFAQLVFLDQIRRGFPELNWDIWTTVMRRYREMPQSDWDALDTDLKRRDYFMMMLCDITQIDLTPHFEVWTIDVSDDAKTSCAIYPALTQQIWYINGADN